MEKKDRGLYGILFLVFVFFVIFVVLATYTLKTVFKFSDDLKVDDSKVTNPIAVVEVNGVILQAKKIIDKLHIAEESKNIKAIIVRIDSPGGAVAPTQEIYHEILRIDKIKPVYASFGSIAASGGYYIGSAARKIYANAGTLTGSIGVIMQFMNLSRLYEFVKISPDLIKAGRYKDAGHPHRALTSEERGLLQDMLSGVHQQFIDDIKFVRRERIKGDMNEHAQGQIFSGEMAKSLGLVDELGSLWQAGREIHKELKLEGKFGFKFIKIKRKFEWWEFINNIEHSISKFKVSLPMDTKPMFLYKL